MGRKIDKCPVYEQAWNDYEIRGFEREKPQLAPCHFEDEHCIIHQPRSSPISIHDGAIDEILEIEDKRVFDSLCKGKGRSTWWSR